MSRTIIHNGTLVTSEKECIGSVVIDNDIISDILYSDSEDYPFRISKILSCGPDTKVIEAQGKYIMAGGIDGHVHFREPGLTHKADIETESMAAAAGGVTSVIDMPNTQPATVTACALKEKIEIAKGKSAVNIGFHIGATNTNFAEIDEVLNNEKSEVTDTAVGGVKVFMGSSTGNMLVDEVSSLKSFFGIKGKTVLVHCEDEATIRSNMAAAAERYGEDIPFAEHENIRSRIACIKSSIKALEMAINNGTRLVLCHISTKEELEMVRAAKLNNPEIHAETSCNYLWFCNDRYESMGSRIKCNPSIKTATDRDALRQGLAEGTIDIIGSDHAPHLISEKENIYSKAPSGLPSIQQTLPVLLTIAAEEEIPLTRIASVFSEKASEIYGLQRGKLKTGYHADLVIFDKDKEFTVSDEDQFSKCGWTPYKGTDLKGHIEYVIVNGKIVIENGILDKHNKPGQILSFNQENSN